MIETCEESGSPDLPAYIDALRARLGNVGLVVCLDSGAGNYDQLWLTTSLRGNVSGTLKVEILTEGVHSGDASGLVPSSFRILRQVLDRLEDSKTGRLLPESFHCAIPADRIEQAQATAKILGDEVWKRFPWACGADGGADAADDDRPGRGAAEPHLAADAERHRRRRLPGAEGRRQRAAPVHRVQAAACACRRWSTATPRRGALKTLLEDNAPYNAKVTFRADGRGRRARARPAGTRRASRPGSRTRCNAASQAHFGAPCGYIGQGGTIPLMSMLQQGFPAAQMMVCGVLGPKSNAHGPNEFLHVPYGKKLTAAVAQVMAAHP